MYTAVVRKFIERTRLVLSAEIQKVKAKINPVNKIISDNESVRIIPSSNNRYISDDSSCDDLDFIHDKKYIRLNFNIETEEDDSEIFYNKYWGNSSDVIVIIGSS